MNKFNPDTRPIRMRGFIEFAKKYPGEAAAVAFDDMRATLMEMGVGIERIAALEDRTPENVRKLGGMSDEEAFAFFKKEFERYLVECGVNESIIRSLKYV
jgi:hypothetical protein